MNARSAFGFLPRRASGLATVVIFLVPGAVAAETDNLSQCSSYLGKLVQVQTFDEAIAPLAKISPKDEYETSEQYRSRISSIQGSNNGPLIIAKNVEDSKYIPYDADRHKLKIQSYAFHNTNFSAWDAFYSAQITEPKASTGENIAVVISDSDVASGSYDGGNSFGATTKVQRFTKTTKAIFQRSAVGSERLFRNIDRDSVIGELDLSADEARNLKPNLQIAFVVTPKPPFLVRATYPLGKPTIANPRETKVNATILIADIQCGLLLNDSLQVLGAYDAQGSKK